MLINAFVKRMIAQNREFILKEMLAVKGLMHILMKPRNTGGKWTAEEKKEIKVHLRHISQMVPVLIIFLLPGGSLMLPFLAGALDRRTQNR